MAAGEFSGWREKLSTSLLAEQWPDELQNIVTKLANGTSLNREDGHVLFNSKDLDIFNPRIIKNFHSRAPPKI